MLGSWAGVTSDLITLFKSKGVIVYSQPIYALDTMVGSSNNPSNDQPVVATIPTVTVMLVVGTRAHTFLSDILVVEVDFATKPVMGKREIEIPSRYAPAGAPSRPRRLVLPGLRTPMEYASAP